MMAMCLFKRNVVFWDVILIFYTFLVCLLTNGMMRRQRNKNFICTLCTNAFSDRAHLRAHEVSHVELH